VLGAFIALAFAGCGSEPTFTAAEFTRQVNEQGVDIRIGRQLPNSGNADQLFAVRLPRLPGQPPAPPDSEGNGGASGTLYVYGDAGGAGNELDACRAAGGLLCYRASNIVVVLDEETGGLQARRLSVAIKRLGSE
jgi:hypothetical protein